MGIINEEHQNEDLLEERIKELISQGRHQEESEFVELKLALARGLAKARRRKRMTQVELAKLVKSSQSRVAKMEAGDPTVSMDLLVKSHLALGTRRKTLARMMTA